MSDVWSHDDLKKLVVWLENVPWQLFCTFTFAWPVSDAQAAQVFKTFVQRVERSLHCPIVYVRGDEKRFSGCGKPAAPRHYHTLLAAAVPLDDEFIAATWMSMAGFRANGAGADVRRYDPSGNALAYTLKFIAQPGGDWDFRNLDFYLRQPLASMNRRMRRRLARHERRISQARESDRRLVVDSEAPGNSGPGLGYADFGHPRRRAGGPI